MTFRQYLTNKKMARKMNNYDLLETTDDDATDAANVWFDVREHEPPEGVRLIGQRRGLVETKTFVFYYRRLDERPESAIFLGGDLNPIEPPTRWRYFNEAEE